jgi:hypothetical protein
MMRQEKCYEAFSIRVYLSVVKIIHLLWGPVGQNRGDFVGITCVIRGLLIPTPFSRRCAMLELPLNHKLYGKSPTSGPTEPELVA